RTADQIIRTGHAVYPVLGATIDLGYGGPGARIVQVQPGSAAAGTDLESGDVITVIDGHRVRGAEDLIVQIRRHRPGEDVELTYRGDGDQDRVRVTLGKQIG
ncbi:MAG: PDZ domain-containing protein, partial [Nocardioidaceae bacterium]